MRDKQRLYLMQNSIGLSKVGIALNPTKRKRQLELASGTKIDIVKCWITLDTPALEVEQFLHRQFGRRRLQGEWFSNISIPDIEYAGYDLVECKHDGSQYRGELE